MLIDKFEKFLEILKKLWTDIKFINTDLKLANIFINHDDEDDTKFNQLKDIGLNTQFVMLISDVDKARFVYPETNVQCNTNPGLIKRRGLSHQQYIVGQVRNTYLSETQLEKYKYFDVATITNNLVALICNYYNRNNKTDMINKFKPIIEFLIKQYTSDVTNEYQRLIDKYRRISVERVRGKHTDA